MKLDINTLVRQMAVERDIEPEKLVDAIAEAISSAARKHYKERSVRTEIDPETGERTRAVFSCAQQDQPLAWIDLDNLAARQSQNRLSEHLSARWLDYVLTQET